MIKRTRVYICDHCGAVAREITQRISNLSLREPPVGWRKLGKEDLCPTCSEVYSKLKQEIVKENK